MCYYFLLWLFNISLGPVYSCTGYNYVTFLSVFQGFEPMIDASESGLPVDLTQVTTKSASTQNRSVLESSFISFQHL